jgi:hypothetical protein
MRAQPRTPDTSPRRRQLPACSLGRREPTARSFVSGSSAGHPDTSVAEAIDRLTARGRSTTRAAGARARHGVRPPRGRVLREVPLGVTEKSPRARSRSGFDEGRGSDGLKRCSGN